MKLSTLLIVLAIPTALVLTGGCGGEEKHASHSGTGMKDKSTHQTHETVKIAQKTCPVMKGKIDPKVYVEHNGRKIYFCCPGGCKEKFAKDPKKYIKIVDAEIKKGSV